jgi:hypothetical protein
MLNASLLAALLCSQCHNGICLPPDHFRPVQQLNLAIPRVTADPYAELTATRQALANARTQLDAVLQAWADSQTAAAYQQPGDAYPYQQPLYASPSYRSLYSIPYGPTYRRPLIGALERRLLPARPYPRAAQPKMR